MARISKSDVNAALHRAADQIKEAGGQDGRVSHADIRDKLGELEGTEQALVDIFYRFIDHRDHEPGAQVTAKDIDRAVKYAEEHLVAKYDLNSNGLSRDEIAQMSTTGKLAVELARELKAAAAAGASGEHKEFGELMEIAESFLTDKMAPKFGWEQIEIWDAIDATDQWFSAAKFPLYYHQEGTEEEDLVKIDFSFDTGGDYTEECGIGMDRRSGDVLEVYINRRTYGPGDF